jgi:hypothetical protein
MNGSSRLLLASLIDQASKDPKLYLIVYRRGQVRAKRRLLFPWVTLRMLWSSSIWAIDNIIDSGDIPSRKEGLG